MVTIGKESIGMKEKLVASFEMMRHGFVRFAPFNVGAVLLAASLIWWNHVPWEERKTTVLPIALAYGVCWGMLTALAVRLALERRAARQWLQNAVPAVLGLLTAVVGTWFWYCVREGNVYYGLWRMVYWGGVTALAAAAMASLFGKRNRLTLFGQLIQSASFVGMISFATMLGGFLCVEAYRELIAKISGDCIEDVMLIVWSMIAPIFMAACLPQDDTPTERSRWFNVLFWFLTPLGIALITILYVYIVRIMFEGMPSGKMNWYASCALAGYLLFWLALRASSVRFFARVARWGWIALVPVVVTQIVGIVIRYQAHGLTTPRMAGMVTLAIGIYALVLAALDRDAKSLFVVTAVAGLVFTVTPLNIVDIPLREQSSRLRRVLQQYGCLSAEGALSVPDKPDIPLKDAQKLVSAWKYLVNRYNHAATTTNVLPVRPGVWYRASFAQGVLAATHAARKNCDLSALLKIDESKFALSNGSKRCTTHNFHLDEHGMLNIGGYTGMYWVKSTHLFEESGDERYCLKFSDDVATLLTTNICDVTEHMNRIREATGAKTRWRDGRWHDSCPFAPELAIWPLADDVALVVTGIYCYIDSGERKPFSGHVNGFLLVKPNHPLYRAENDKGKKR